MLRKAKQNCLEYMNWKFLQSPINATATKSYIYICISTLVYSFCLISTEGFASTCDKTNFGAKITFAGYISVSFVSKWIMSNIPFWVDGW